MGTGRLQLSPASSSPRQLPKNVPSARQAALPSTRYVCWTQRHLSAVGNRDSASGRVLSACQPHSGLWRPAGVWRISCTAAPPFCRADNILRGVWMAGPDPPPRWTPPPLSSSCLLCCTHTCSARTRPVTKSSRRHNTRQNRLAGLIKR